MSSEGDLSVWRPLPGSRSLCKLFMHLFSNYHVSGHQNIPSPPYLVTPNHVSFWDAPAVGPQIDDILPTFTARKYKNTLTGFMLHLGSPIWIEQDSADRHALMTALKLIHQGYPFAIAPEGTRSKTGGLLQGHEGVAFLATRANVPILPVAVWGTAKMFKEIRPTVHVVFGKPYKLPEGRARGDQLAEYTDRIMCAIAALLPEAYRGYYRDNPLVAEMAEKVN